MLLPFLAVATEPDVLISTSGEKFIGELESATAADVTFNSQAAGEITVPWSKVKELHSTRRFAVIPRNVKIPGAEEAKAIPEGTVSVADKRIEIKPAPKAAARTVPITDSSHVVDEESFRHSFESPGFFGGWSPSFSAGISFIAATQNERSFDGEVNLERAVPGVDWRNPSDRTLIDLSASYDRTHSLLASNPAMVRDVIYQANIERDQYLAPRLFLLGQATYDHNYSQNLNLGWTYQGGLGWAVWKKAGQELDLKGTLGYIQRLYYLRASNRTLFASTFGETYRNKRKHGIEFHEELDYIPAWNDSSAYAAAGKAGLSVPISESFSVDFNSKDSFLNGVPAAYKKNSFEFSVDLSYTP
jgi:Protein of unknown function, DUF481